MKVAILGTRGIPNHYGGFEQFAQYLSKGLAEKGHQVYVYNSHNHPFKEKVWNGVNIISKYDPENKIGTIGQFIYDFNCIMDCRNRNFDVILQLGYTSSSVWARFFPKSSVIITNMDGLEWKRTKYNKYVRKFLLYAERLAVKTSDVLIADSIGIQKYLKARYKYKINSCYIPYGTDVFEIPDSHILNKYDLTSFGYNMLIARIEPENSIEIILDGIAASDTDMPFLIIGNYHVPFGAYLMNKFRHDKRIRFIGPLYDIEILNNLRYFSNFYFHGHTVGGTNPSLLEAMGSHALICAHQNLFNRAILGDEAFYFETAQDVTKCLNEIKRGEIHPFIEANLKKIKELYSWKEIIDTYEQCMLIALKYSNETEGYSISEIMLNSVKDIKFSEEVRFSRKAV